MELKNYKSFEELQEHITENGADDYFKVKGVVYTMDNYDEEGKEISFGNKKQDKAFKITTVNRYLGGFDFCEVEEFKPCCFRNDITYFE